MWTKSRSGRACVAIAGALAWAGAVSSGAHAETIYYYEPHTGNLEAVDTADPGRHASLGAPQARIGGSARGGAVTYNITYKDVVDNANFGFDDSTLGATRQATLQAVLTYVDDILNETTGASIDVTVNNSETDGGGYLAFAGTYFTVATGFTNGLCFQHITTGTDPNGTFEDIFVTVDFGFNWNSDTGPVGPTEYDLFTVLLHEITHGIGFLGLTGLNGSSLLTAGNPGPYSVLNQNTQLDDANPVGTGSSTPLWTTAGGASYVGTAGNLTGAALVFTGANAVAAYGSNPTIYSHNPYTPGSSQSHWGNDLINLAVMPASVSNNVENRSYAAFEIGALKDLGYSNASGGPPASPDPDQDLLTDAEELIEETDPNNPDTDGDGVMDGIEVDLGTDPLNPFDFPILPLGMTLGLVTAMAAAGAVVLVRVRRKASRAR